MIEKRYAIDPKTCKTFQSNQLREAFLIQNIFQDNEVSFVYSHYDRLIIGGIKPVSGSVVLNTHDFLKADYFLQRREIGIINVGAKGTVKVDGQEFAL